MPVPLDVEGVGVDDEGLADVVVAIHLQDHLNVGLRTVGDVELDLSPAQVELLVEIVCPGEELSQRSLAGRGKLLG